ncbi:MAG: hypothetical protein HQK54_06075 [Oligoflexales bacterium]|nr:hypothetical protein [Oligoflexales bacterium]
MGKSVVMGQLKNIDSQKSMSFLISIASALVEFGFLTQKDVDDFRACLRNLHLSDIQDGETVLLKLFYEKNDFLSMLASRFGYLGLCANLFRMTFGSELIRTNEIMTDFGKSLIEKSKLFFNRSFYSYLSGRCEDRKLFSSILVDLADSIATFEETIDGIANELQFLSSCNLALKKPDDDKMDETIALHLGLKGSKNEVTFFKIENCACKNLSNAVSIFLDIINDLIVQFGYNFSSPHIPKILFICETLASDATKLSIAKFSINGELSSWELRRFSFVSTLVSINQSFISLFSCLSDLFGSYNSSRKDEKIIPDSMKRQIAFDLLSKGIPVLVAQKTSESLFSYCKNQKISPKEIIPTELSKISPHLSQELLESLQIFEIDSAFSNKRSDEKEIILKRSHSINQFFNRKSISIANLLIFILAVLQFGCGVKTPPRSEEKDFRPEIPFRDSFYPADPEKDVLPVTNKSDNRASGKKNNQAPADSQKNSTEINREGK